MKKFATQKSKKLMLVLGAILAVAAIVATSVFATVAYLTSTSYVTNTFTIGNVGIEMYESKVNPDGTLYDEGATKVSENKYHLVPNKTYIKDPTITVAEGSEASYLFIIIHNGIEAIECAEDHDEHLTIAEQLANNGWKQYKTMSNGTVYVYVGEGDTAEAVTAGNYKLFETFTISSEASATIANYGTANVTINAMAIQAATLDEATAWSTLAETYAYIVGTPVN